MVFRINNYYMPAAIWIQLNRLVLIMNTESTEPGGRKVLGHRIYLKDGFTL